MTGFAKRIEGLLFVGFGLLLYFIVIPRQTDSFDYGWLKPDTVPNAMAAVLFLCGIWLALFPTGHEREDPRQTLQAAMYMGVIALGVFIVSLFGFLYVAPFLALVIMVLIGERRWFWLLLGVAGVPTLIWFAVEVLLHRPLPG
ncbi:tripartite tricarboxylate transporter TctB family protein [Aquicoccus sp. G2-2]|uniref:tripartite tricarboxylate transporter TctB family protein n=1 Tax=Aquicoccus sp. G2-2 TaxID=3092120 RepID=UPI002ADF6C5D|nr:tripartite tricarboxylate transporter TctB family protein [Aquicoccus sp. G2-2]MEA1114818.1 tripartite tricarboxylate transporter TctB family protein [Aquicoccus sp. G2-2]